MNVGGHKNPPCCTLQLGEKVKQIFEYLGEMMSYFEPITPEAENLALLSLYP
jgi:hypothetical protein